MLFIIELILIILAVILMGALFAGLYAYYAIRSAADWIANCVTEGFADFRRVANW